MTTQILKCVRLINAKNMNTHVRSPIYTLSYGVLAIIFSIFFQDSCMDYFTGDTNNSPEHRCSTSNFDHAENLYLRFKNAEASQSKLREAYSSLQTSYKELEKRLHDAECQTLNAEELKVRLEELECESRRITDSDQGEIRNV